MYLMDYSDNYYVRTKAFTLNTNKLNESLQCDVCIIGAGLSGIFKGNSVTHNNAVAIVGGGGGSWQGRWFSPLNYQ